MMLSERSWTRSEACTPTLKFVPGRHVDPDVDQAGEDDASGVGDEKVGMTLADEEMADAPARAENPLG